MPIFKAGQKLIYYAHVPKCGGSAVEHYLADRFGSVAFQNIAYMSLAEHRRWSKTSPQHIDVASLELLFPKDFFDASFAIVRNPVDRLVSAYHFQIDVEKRIPATTSFPEWLQDIHETMEDQPFSYDNHIRPMAEIVPEGAKVFHLEHGLDAMIPWLDQVTGQKAGLRAVPHINKQGDYGGAKRPKVELTKTDRALVARLYGEDFERFGYVPDQKAPTMAAPDLSAETIAERDAALKQMNTPMSRVKATLRKAIRR